MRIEHERLPAGVTGDPARYAAGLTEEHRARNPAPTDCRIRIPTSRNRRAAVRAIAVGSQVIRGHAETGPPDDQRVAIRAMRPFAIELVIR